MADMNDKPNTHTLVKPYLNAAKKILSMVEGAIADIDRGQRHLRAKPLTIGETEDVTDDVRAKLVGERDRGRALVEAMQMHGDALTAERIDEIMRDYPMPETLPEITPTSETKH